jgi:peptide chain release factor 1
LIPKSDIKVERIRGTGPGGQRKNKVATCVRLTHLPTGIVVTADCRTQPESMRKALKDLDKRLAEASATAKAEKRKAKRDHAIKNETTIRTYDFKSGQVRDHRTGKTAPIKQVLGKGKIELLK